MNTIYSTTTGRLIQEGEREMGDTNENDLRKYRTELPNIIDEMELSVYAFRLYVHIKRVAGETEDGACWQSTKTLASYCKMSAGKVSEAKRELVAAGLITVVKRTNENGAATDCITIRDIWPQNFAHFAARSPGERPTASVSPGEQSTAARSPGERPNRASRSPGETKKEPINRNFNIKGSDAPASPPPAPPRERKRDLVFEAVLAACGWSLDLLTDKQRGRVNRALKKLREHRDVTPEGVEAYAAWFRRSDWRGKKGELPTPELMVEQWDQAHRQPEPPQHNAPLDELAQTRARIAEVEAEWQKAEGRERVELGQKLFLFKQKLARLESTRAVAA